MGQLLSTFQDQWYVYKRIRSTDHWSKEPTKQWEGISLEDALKYFKHETWAFALEKYPEYENTKAIYLYNGNTRVAKSLIDAESSQLNIWSPHIREWLSHAERLPKNRYPLLQSIMFRKYIDKHGWVDSQTISYVIQTKE